jgi:hypothetical protein
VALQDDLRHALLEMLGRRPVKYLPHIFIGKDPPMDERLAALFYKDAVGEISPTERS